MDASRLIKFLEVFKHVYIQTPFHILEFGIPKLSIFGDEQIAV